LLGKWRYALFWLSAFFMPKEKYNDFPRVCCCFFGVAFNMLTFSRVKPYFSYLGICNNGDHPNDCTRSFGHYHEERMRKLMVIGIILGLIGTGSLILYSRSIGSATNASLGNILVFCKCRFYGFTDNRKRINGYNAFTFVKWIYLFGFNGIAFGWSQFEATDWAVVPHWCIGK
jgi:hypothetical protein